MFNGAVAGVRARHVLQGEVGAPGRDTLQAT